MRNVSKMTKRLLVTLLATVLALGNVPMQVAWAIESASSADASSQVAVQADQAGEPIAGAADSAVDAGEGVTNESDESASSASQAAEEPQNANAVSSSNETDSSAAQPEEESPYSLEVTFDGKTLSEGQNPIDGTWTSNGAKTASIEVERTGTPKAGKAYVLSMKVPSELYFTGEPDISKIGGLSEVVTKRNAAPQVFTNGSRTVLADLPGFSNYSGEIRMKINTGSLGFQLTNIDVNFNEKMVGYSSEAYTIAQALDVKIVEVDASETLADYTDENATCLVERAANDLSIKNGSGSSGLRMAVSTDGFASTNYNTNQSIARSGSIGFTVGTAASTYQVYKRLVVAFKCPYIEVGGTKHYLSFDEGDTSLSTNKHGNSLGLKPATSAIYNESDHTIIYTFENIYVGNHEMFLVSPEFKWPSDLGEADAPDSSYEITGAGYTVKESTCYTGTTSRLTNAGLDGTLKNIGSFVAESANVTLTSSAEAPDDQRIAKRSIYKGMTIDTGVPGTLGFFDIHNTGAANASPVKIEFNFDYGGTATGYVTRVNLPVSGNSSGTTVHYVLVNADDLSDTREGDRTYSNSTSFACLASDLRSNSQLGSNSRYFIKSLSYTSNALAKNHAYHAETAHLNRNREADSGLFFGYVKGDVGSTFKATMSISSADSTTPITTNGDTRLESTETCTLSDADFIGALLNAPSLDGAASASITAGSSAKLSFYVTPSTEEYNSPTSGGTVDGYHILRDAVVYVCLPDGVSITGENQVAANSNGRKVEASSVKPLGDVFDVGGTRARWWEIDLDGANVPGGKSLSVTLTLSTNRLMNGATWDFRNALVVRAKGQELSWNAASQTCRVVNKVNELTGSSQATLSQLGALLSGDQYGANKLGALVSTGATACTLSVARAEAKLDVSTNIKQEGQTAEPGKSLRLTSEDATLDYDVIVSSTDGGQASGFSYYIPITKAGAALDADAFVSESEFSLRLTGRVSITGNNKGGEEVADPPFVVYYTTAPDLTSLTIAEDGVTWLTEDQVADFSQVTAVKIVTRENASIWDGSTFKFALELSYDGSSSDFAANAGREVAWRTFGHYTYTISSTGAQTTNTYPSGTNSVKLGYVSDRANAPVDVTLDASVGTSSSAELDLGQTFNTDRTFRIKKVSASNVTLTSDDPSGLAGRKANETFRVSLGLNELDKRMLSAGAGGSFGVSAGTDVKVQVGVDFSSALTDTATDRYVDVVLGDDDVDVTLRIRLKRNYTPASVTDAGVAAGEQYIVPTVSDSASVASNSAFTALFPINGFFPGNYGAQKLKWKKSSGSEAAIPAGTTVIMVGLKDDGTPDSYWLWTSDGSENEVDLKEFKRMGSDESFSYNTTSTAETSLKYLFVVNFAAAKAQTGSYKIAFGADAVADAAAFADVDKDVTLVEPGSYGLEASGNTLTYTVGEASADESYRSGKTLSVVLKPAAGTTLPSDAKLEDDGGTTYRQNSKGEFVVPLGGFASGSKTFSIVSSQLPSSGASYKLDASLVLVGSTVGASPDAGDVVAGGAQITLVADKRDTPSLSVSGTRVAKVADWNAGQPLNLRIQGVPDGGYVTVSVFEGVSDAAPVTDLLSAVDGRFDFQNGVGTLNGNSPSGLLKLSPTAKPGTYRLVFDVMDADGAKLLSVPYVIIVRP